jgi:hypothetical protein
MADEFRPVEGYPGYRVSRTGEVQSFWARKRRAVVPTESWHPLKPILRNGYLTVNLARGGKKSARRIHRLVLEAFVGPCPEGHVACHGDGDPTNNRLENLRWGTHQSNADDTLRHGRRKMGSQINAKLVEAEVIEIRRLRAEDVTSRELASRFGVTKENILAIVNRRSWRHLP